MRIRSQAFHKLKRIASDPFTTIFVWQFICEKQLVLHSKVMRGCRIRAGRFTRADTGAAAVEFAIICPLLIYFILTVLYLGLYVGVAHSLQQLAADGARASVAGLGDPERRQLTIDYVNAAAPRYFAITNDRLDIDFQSDASAARVTLTYDAGNVLSWYPQAFVPVLDTTITRAAVVRLGGF